MYKFSNLLGTVYSKGNLEFTPDGFTLISPVGNRITFYDLKEHLSSTLPIEGTVSFTCMSLSPNGCLLLTANEIGEVYVISTTSQSILHILKPGGSIKVVKFSPDGSLFAVAKESSVLVYTSPVAKAVFNPFELRRGIAGVKDVVDLDWSDDSRLLVITSGLGTLQIHPTTKFTNFKSVTLTGNTEGCVRSFFLQHSYDLYSIEKNGTLKVWSCSKKADEFIVDSETQKFDPMNPYSWNGLGKTGSSDPSSQQQPPPPPPPPPPSDGYARFNRIHKFYYSSLFEKGVKRPPITSVEYSAQAKLLVTGFEGVFFIHEMPDFNMIQSLKISEASISTIRLNRTGDWIAFGAPSMGQLLVWEWQSETYIMKQQGHFDLMETFDYSPDGQILATGGVDGKVKLWNSRSCYCFVTFSEHTAPVTGIVFPRKGNSLLSSSLDGTVRAFDLKRYRNFRTFSTPRSVQFGCLSVDSGSELVVAGGKDVFDLYLWSMKTGRLLEILNGHEGPISAVSFSPFNGSSKVASVSMDKTLRIWDSVEASGQNEKIPLPSEGTCLAFSPNGKELAVGTLDSHITFFGEDGLQKGSIFGRHHIHAGRASKDLVTAKTLNKSKQFRTLAYSPDGKLLLAAGSAKNICIYNAQRQHLVATFLVSKNHSYDGIEGFIHHKKLTEFGNMDLLVDRDEDSGNKLSLPGVRKGDMAARTYQNEIRVTCVKFSPTGRSWGATTTEGLLIYSSELDNKFDPIGATLQVTPQQVRTALVTQKYDEAIMLALRLNMDEHCRLAIESVPYNNIELLLRGLSDKYIPLLVKYLAKEVLKTKRLQFYLTWVESLLRIHLFQVRQNIEEMEPILTDLRRRLEVVVTNIGSIVEKNVEMIEYIMMVANVEKATAAALLNVKVEKVEEEVKEERMEEEDQSAILSN